MTEYTQVISEGGGWQSRNCMMITRNFFSNSSMRSLSSPASVTRTWSPSMAAQIRTPESCSLYTSLFLTALWRIIFTVNDLFLHGLRGYKLPLKRRALEPPVIHRDVKTSNILLDNAFHVKVADLGICPLLPWDTTEVSMLPQGTTGYRDPEYDSYFKLTDKIDVYSFGVVLLELISGKEAVDVNCALDKIYLDAMAVDMIINKKLKEFVDPKLGYQDSQVGRMINSVVELAYQCLLLEGKMRPRMVRVLAILKEIERSAGFGSTEPSHQMSFGLASVFPYEELKEATNSFDPLRVLGDDGCGRVIYPGKLKDGWPVVVKKISECFVYLSVQLSKEVPVISRLRHGNLATLYGCTGPHVLDMFLVYADVPNCDTLDQLVGVELDYHSNIETKRMVAMLSEVGVYSL